LALLSGQSFDHINETKHSAVTIRLFCLLQHKLYAIYVNKTSPSADRDCVPNSHYLRFHLWL